MNYISNLLIQVNEVLYVGSFFSKNRRYKMDVANSIEAGNGALDAAMRQQILGIAGHLTLLRINVIYSLR